MYGDLIEAFVRDAWLAFKSFVAIGIVLIVAVSIAAFFIGRGCAPTPESIKKQEQRQAVIESLTQEQREALGL